MEIEGRRIDLGKFDIDPGWTLHKGARGAEICVITRYGGRSEHATCPIKTLSHDNSLEKARKTLVLRCYCLFLKRPSLVC